jgi:hypothetical protein
VDGIFAANSTEERQAQRLTELDLTCFGYLAPARVLRIARYPEPNGDAEVLSTANVGQGQARRADRHPRLS